MTVEAARAFGAPFTIERVADLGLTELDRMQTAVKTYYTDEFSETYLNTNNARPNIEIIFPKDRLELYRQYRYIAGNEYPR